MQQRKQNTIDSIDISYFYAINFNVLPYGTCTFDSAINNIIANNQFYCEFHSLSKKHVCQP